jgi:2-hydroxycyclohexanecarboxyl-CoA dehydrogenase
MGPISVLVNLIGWCETHPFMDESSEYWRRVIAINFESILFVCHAVLPGMITRREGKIVNVSSDAGRVGSGGEAVYAAAKGAVIAFTKSLAREVARFGICVNCTAPGPTDTPLEANQDPEVVKRIVRLIPFRRMANTAEQAAAIAFFCSEDSDYVTGQTLSVSGGLTML